MQRYKIRTYKYDGEELRVGGTEMNNSKVLQSVKKLVIDRYGKFDISKLEYIGEREFEITKQMVQAVEEA